MWVIVFLEIWKSKGVEKGFLEEGIFEFNSLIRSLFFLFYVLCFWKDNVCLGKGEKIIIAGFILFFGKK